MTVQTCSCHITSHTHTHTHTHRFFKNAFKKTRSPIRATALTTHMHRSTSSHPMSSWTCQAPHLLVIEEDFVKHVCIKAPPFFAPKLMLACTFMTVVQNHSLAIVAQFLSLRPTTCHAYRFTTWMFFRCEFTWKCCDGHAIWPFLHCATCFGADIA